MNTATGDNNKNQIRTYLSTRTIEARQTQPHDNQKYASFHVVAIMTLFLVTTRHLSRSITPIARAFTTTPLLQGRIGGGRDKDPRIKITLEQLRMAARGRGRGVPICHEQQEKIMNALEAAKYENGPIYKYVMEFDKCYEEHKKNNSKGKDRTLMKELNKYLVRPRKKQK